MHTEPAVEVPGDQPARVAVLGLQLQECQEHRALRCVPTCARRSPRFVGVWEGGRALGPHMRMLSPRMGCPGLQGASDCAVTAPAWPEGPLTPAALAPILVLVSCRTQHTPADGDPGARMVPVS